MSDELPPTEYELNNGYDLPGMRNLLALSEDVKITLEVVIKKDFLVIVEEGNFQKRIGDFQMETNLHIEPLDVIQVFGSNIEAIRFLINHLQMVFEEISGDDER